MLEYSAHLKFGDLVAYRILAMLHFPIVHGASKVNCKIQHSVKLVILGLLANIINK